MPAGVSRCWSTCNGAPAVRPSQSGGRCRPGCEPFGGLGRQERFELLAGVAEPLGSGLGEDRPPGKPAPFGCLYGPLSAERRGAFLQRLPKLASSGCARALAAVACFQSAPRTRGSHGCTQKKGVSRSLAERFNCK